MRYLVCGLIVIGYVFEHALALAAESVSPTPITYFQQDHRYSYEIELLERALALTDEEYGPAVATPKTYSTHLRGIFALTRGKIDVVFLGTSIRYEEDFLPVRIPVLQGLLGYRLLLTTRDKLSKIDTLNTLAQLQKDVIAGFGLHWEDARILRHNQLLMVESSHYTTIFKSLYSGTVDYVPRGLNEVFNELEEQKKYSSDIALSKDAAIFYPHLRYFFVAKYNHALAERLQKGLVMALEDGSFKSIFDKHFGHLKSYLETHQHQVIALENPYLPLELPLVQVDWWLPESQMNQVNYNKP